MTGSKGMQRGNLILRDKQVDIVHDNVPVSESEKSYRNIFESSIDAIYILNEGCVFIEVNPAAERMYGYEKREIVGFTPAKLSAPGRNDLLLAEELILRALKGEPQRFEWWGLRKNGEEFPKDVVLNKGIYFGKEVVFAMARDISDRYKSLEALRESEDKYRSLTDQIPVGIYRTAIDGRFIYTNPALNKILGYSVAEELYILNVCDLYLNPNERNQQVKKSAKLAGVIQSEFQLKKKDGGIIWVKDHSRLVSDKNGAPLYFDGIIEDISDSVNAESAIKESEANLKAIIENSIESIWSIDLDYQIKYVNEVFANSFMQTFGVQLMPGVNILDALPPEIRQLWKERYDRAFNNEHFVFEDKVDTPVGPVYVEVAMNPIVVDSKVVGASFYGKNVTDKKIAELQLQYISELHKLLVELSSAFINLPIKEINYAINDSLVRIGSYIGSDRSYIFDYDFILSTATNTFEWCREGVSPQIMNMQQMPLENLLEWSALHQAGKIVKVDNTVELPDNPLKELLLSQDVVSLLTIPLLSEGKCIGFVGFDWVFNKHIHSQIEQQLLQVYAQTLVNVKERQQKELQLIGAKEKAEESDRLKSAFLANMSHEIRTPMNGIIGFLDLLKEPDLSDENKSVYINIVTQSGRRLLETINDIIEISKIETGEMKIQYSPVNITELMGYYHGFFKQQTDHKGLEYRITNHLPSDVKNFKTDRNKLESIISNLIKNAIKFTNSGIIEFGCALQEGFLLFFVRDTGVGIASDQISRVFDRFVQADMSSSRHHEGSGLGLSITKAYVQMLGGSIIVESEPGKGSLFTVTIPFIKADVLRIENGNMTPVSSNNHLKATILIAEDDQASYLYLEKLLSGKGITFIHTTNGVDTVKFVRENPNISLVLMDIRMPLMSGLEATKQIREFNAKIPIIAQTAYSLSGDREMALSAGCTDYISKPLNRAELLRITAKYTGRQY